jgi:Mg-chelatase subunit ChlD
MIILLSLTAFFLLALFIFGITKDTYHSPLGSVAVYLSRAAVMGVLLAVLLAGLIPKEETPEVVILTDVIVFEDPASRRWLNRFFLEAQDSRVELKVFAFQTTPSSRPQETPTIMGREIPVFSTFQSGLLKAGRTFSKSRDDRIYVISPNSALLERSYGGNDITYLRIKTPHMVQEVISRLTIPRIGLEGMEQIARVSARKLPEKIRLDFIIDGEIYETRDVDSSKNYSTTEPEFPFRIMEPGTHWISLVALNETGRLLDFRNRSILIRPRPNIYYVGYSGQRVPLMSLLEQTGYIIKRIPASALRDPTIGPLEGTKVGDVVILDEVPAGFLTPNSVKKLTRTLLDRRGSLLIVPGETLGPETRGTLLENLLPVKLGPDADDTERSLALVAVVDTSLSMFFKLRGVKGGFHSPGGVKGGYGQKMEMAKRALINLSSAMRPEDRMGILGATDQPYWVTSPSQPRDPDREIELITRLKAYGAGINLYSSLLAAFNELVKIESDIKHILIFLDTADVDEYEVAETGDVWDLLSRLREEGISISLVGFGRSDDEHVLAMNQIASESGGYLYLTSDLEDIPGFFIEDLKQITDHFILRGPLKVFYFPQDFPSLGSMPELKGQVVTTLKPGALKLAWSERDYPVFAIRKVGEGNVGFFASDSGTSLADLWLKPDQGPLWDQFMSKLIPPPEELVNIGFDREVNGAKLSLRLDQKTEGDAPQAVLYRSVNEPVRNSMTERAPGEYEVFLRDIGGERTNIDIIDGSENGQGWASLSLPPVDMGVVAMDLSIDFDLDIEKESLPASLNALRDSVIVRLILLLVVSILIIDEFLRSP